MTISIVVAIAENGGIGLNNDLPWPRIPADMKWFRQVTMGNCLVMGRKTWESIGSKPLPGRTTVVVTRRADFTAVGAAVAHDLRSAVESCEETKEVMILGGADIFRQAIPMVGRIYLTRIHETFEADTFFPDVDWSEWRVVQKTVVDPDATTLYPLTFEILERQLPDGTLP